MGDADVRVICGPTAAGKSSLAMALAERHRATIISADSRQVYRGFDIGTAKPDAAERARVPHEGLDLAAPEERFSAARWAEGARSWVHEARAAGRVPLIVGGTGFYLRALAEPLASIPDLDRSRRAALAAELERMPTDALRRWCTELDAPRAHLGRAQLLRSIETALLSGVPLSAWHRRAPRAPAMRLRYLVVDPGRRALETRIRERVQTMLDQGWEDEVRELGKQVAADAPAWNAAGYEAIRQLVMGRLAREAAVEHVVIATRQYAKRQRTWFRHQLPPARITLLDPAAEDAADIVRTWWDHPGEVDA